MAMERVAIQDSARSSSKMYFIEIKKCRGRYSLYSWQGIVWGVHRPGVQTSGDENNVACP